MYDSVLLSPWRHNGGLQFGGLSKGGFSKGWLKRTSGGIYEDEQSVIVFEDRHLPTGPIRIRKEHTKSYFEHAYDIWVLAPPGLKTAV